MHKIVNPTVEQFLATYSPDVQELAQKARALIQEIVPDAHERYYEKYSSLSYGSGTKMTEGFVYIAPMKNRINLGFYRGAVLPDSDGLLEGTGKLLRHVKVFSVAELEKPAIRQLIIDAKAEFERFSSTKN
jgi:hypothetical protein